MTPPYRNYTAGLMCVLPRACCHRGRLTGTISGKGKMMSVTERYLANNRAYASRYAGPLPMEPSQHLAVVACMDARLDIYAVLGLKAGEASVIRNAGGAITEDVI